MTLSDREKAQDGCVSTAQAARIAGIRPTTIHGWLNKEMVSPTRMGRGIGNHNRYDIRDVTALCAIAALRRKGVSLQKLRLVQTELRREGIESFASCRLTAINRGSGHVDVVLIRDDEERGRLALSLLESPGQTLIAEIALGDLDRETRNAFAQIQSEPALVRGSKPRTKNVKKGQAA